jgi:DNA polymerase III delta prime subunit
MRRVDTCWISGVLDHSLSQGTLIHLYVREQPDAVFNPWAQAFQELNLLPEPLAQRTPITQVYDEADGAFLLLGEPGAGKTTLLLELARDLLSRARADEAHPIPVVFNLSAWAQKRQSIEDWMVEELNSKYHVPHKLAEEWVHSNQILPLLDGLDEIVEIHRKECVLGVNAYRKEHGFLPMVVCSRTSEYLALNTRIALNKAITILPLTLHQIEQYIGKEGRRLGAVKTALSSDQSLREMVSTPLMLTIISQAFQNTPLDTLLSVSDPIQRRHLIFKKYVEVVLNRRGPQRRYSSEQTQHWLAWLARQLEKQNQIEFYLERMQPDTLLPHQVHQRFHHSIVQFVCCIEAFILAGILAWLRGGRTFNEVGGGLLALLGSGPWERVLGWMSYGLGLRGPGGGGLISLVFAIVAVLVGIMVDSTPTGAQSLVRVKPGIFRGIRNGCICAGLVGLFCFLLFGARSGFISGLSYGSSFGILTGLIIGTLSGLTTSLREEKRTEKRYLQGIFPGLCALIGFSCVDEILHVVDDFNYGFVVAVFFYVTYSFGQGNLRIRISPEIQPAEIVAWSWSNVWRNLPRSVMRGFLVGLVTSMSSALCLGFVSGIAREPSYGLALGLVFGPIIGVSVGVAGTLSGLLNSGLESNILQKKDMMRPNEGMRRSARNALLAAAVFGPIGGIISGIACGVSFGLIGHLTTWPILTVCFTIVFGILFSFYFLMVRGGIACLEHFCLRYYLWLKGHIPLHYVRFLEFAAERILLRRIGGGYMFVHRLLLEHFSQDKERNA